MEINILGLNNSITKYKTGDCSVDAASVSKENGIEFKFYDQ
tara:strand:- start:256 stop:378 length:123 start_codon:yes stop_codon:yes gene_type:complete